MIYVLTPSKIDFLRSCEIKGLNQGSKEVKWISHWEQLLGIKIFKNDEVRYGINFSCFTEKEIKRFKIELALRTEK